MPMFPWMRPGGRRRRSGFVAGLFKAKAMNEVDAGLDRATPASVRREAWRACVICHTCL